MGRSYRLPSFQELYIRLDGFGGNPDLLPEDALSADIGAQWHWKTIAIEAAFFQRWINNVILFAPVSASLVRPDNFSAAQAQGVETTVSWDPGLCSSLQADYTWTRAHFGEPSARLPGQPTHRVTGKLGWMGSRCSPTKINRTALKWIRGIRVWTQITAESDMVLGRFNSIPEEGRVLLAAGAAYAYRGVTLTVEGRNLLDKRDAVDAVGFPLPPARFFVALSGTY